MDLESSVEHARELVSGAGAVAVLTGAGISTDSGIPDFRGPNGVWTKNPEAEKKSHIDVWINDPEHRKERWQRLAEGAIWAAKEPNDGHRALVTLEQSGKLHTLVTQNVDGLHQAAGSAEDLVVEVHGTTRRVKCLECGDSAPMEAALTRVRAGEADPPCKTCGGILKSATISFGQALEPEPLMRAERAAHECDVLLAVGTSLGVFPVANMVPIAVNAGAELVIVNAEATGFDHLASVIVRGSISEVLPRIVGAAAPA
ncbi:MAG: Sir2 family NAD-dependent protein deacetylase [Actinomycetota bacterium]